MRVGFRGKVGVNVDVRKCVYVYVCVWVCVMFRAKVGVNVGVRECGHIIYIVYWFCN